MFEDFEQRDDVGFLVVGGRDREVLDRAVQVAQFRGGEGWVGALVGLSDLDDEGGWVDCGYR